MGLPRLNILQIKDQDTLMQQSNTIQHKALADLELQENWWRKFWQLITLIIVHYLSSQQLANKTLADC